jgi:hypothetical protein
LSAQNIERRNRQYNSRNLRLNTSELTEEQQFYVETMGLLDTVQLSAQLKGIGDTVTNQVKPKDLGDSSSGVVGYLGSCRRYEVKVDFAETKRGVGIRNPKNNHEVAFDIQNGLDGKSGEIKVMVGQRVGGKLVKPKEPQDITQQDLLPIIKKGLL